MQTEAESSLTATLVSVTTPNQERIMTDRARPPKRFSKGQTGLDLSRISALGTLLPRGPVLQTSLSLHLGSE